MANIDSSLTASDALSQYSLKTNATGSGDELGKNEFLELLIAQLNNQNPMEPQGNTEFIAQLAQFTQVEEAQKLRTTVENFGGQFRSTQALQASAMVGRSVLVEESTAMYRGTGDVQGFVDLPLGTSDLRVKILNGVGELVDEIYLGQQYQGQVPFAWDGTNAAGEPMPAGRYSIVAQGKYSEGTQQVSTLLGANVDSVSVDERGNITLNLGEYGTLPLDSVRQIN